MMLLKEFLLQQAGVRGDDDAEDKQGVGVDYSLDYGTVQEHCERVPKQECGEVVTSVIA